tara:strand:+ start:570 stop:716 length:147 start_codon:yes stop_codon:yes gene_type:complete
MFSIILLLLAAAAGQVTLTHIQEAVERGAIGLRGTLKPLAVEVVVRRV